MRKYLIVAVAALTALAFTAVAFAQTPDCAHADVKHHAEEGRHEEEAEELADQAHDRERRHQAHDEQARRSRMPKTFKLSRKGLPKCAEATLETAAPPPARRPRRVGKGIANALVGVNGTGPDAADVRRHAQSSLGRRQGHARLLTWPARELPVNVAVTGPRSSTASKLTIEVPEAAQQPASGHRAPASSRWRRTLGRPRRARTTSRRPPAARRRSTRSATVLTFVDNTVGARRQRVGKASSKCSK